MIEFIAQVSEEDFKKITNGETIFQYCKLVRCKDCKREKDTDGMFTICSLTELIVDDDCYCWWGERRKP